MDGEKEYTSVLLALLPDFIAAEKRRLQCG
jgi:hypothetical protein